MLDLVRHERFVLFTAFSVAMCIVIVIIELVLGNWIFRDPWIEAERLGVIRNRVIHYDTASVFAGDYGVAEYKRDGYGLRMSCSKPEQIDILTVGGSTTDQRYIPFEFSFQSILEKELSRRINRNLCIANAGVDGHTTYGHLESFRVWFPLIEGLKPKYIIFYIGINDAGFIDYPSKFDQIRSSSVNNVWQLIRDNSVIYATLREIRFSVTSTSERHPSYAQHTKLNFNQNSRPVDRLTEGASAEIIKNGEQFAERLHRMMDFTANLGAIPICVTQPQRYTKTVDGRLYAVDGVFFKGGRSYNGFDYKSSLERLNHIMRDVCVDSGGKFIDIGSKYFTDNDFYDGVHMTPSGSRRLAQYLSSEFSRLDINITDDGRFSNLK